MAKRKAKGEPPRVLVADDDPTTRRLVEFHLAEAGFVAVLAADGQEALDRLDADIVFALLDLRMPKLGGLEALQEFRRRRPDMPVAVTSEFGSVADAVAAMRLGAVTFLEKPLDPARLVEQARLAAQPAQMASEVRELREGVASPVPPDLFFGASPAVAALLAHARKVAASDATVLLSGETGTGKTTLARWLHEHGPRAGERFIAVSCATLPANLIESALFGHVKGAFTGAVADHTGSVQLADGGTLFLDEIGDLPLELQPKLLTFLQERVFQRVGDPRPRHADLRVIAATNDDLERRVAERSFRGDLYFRLAVLPLAVPPLRERREDIAKFAEFWLARRARKSGAPPLALQPEAVKLLERHPWPGNLRELEHVLERAATFGDGAEIGPADLPLRAAGPAPAAATLAGRTLEDIERQALLETLAHCQGNKKAAAKMLAIDEKSVYNKLRRFGLLPDHEPGPP